jgi:hypothetical protein
MRHWLFLFTTLVLAALSNHASSSEFSVNRSPTNPLNIGFCGASSAFCPTLFHNRKAAEDSTSCQKGFGNCAGEVSTQSAPSCGKDSGTAKRRIAYYEGW